MASDLLAAVDLDVMYDKSPGGSLCFIQSGNRINIRVVHAA